MADTLTAPIFDDGRSWIMLPRSYWSLNNNTLIKQPNDKR